MVKASIAAFAGLLGLASGNFVSPGLKKCLDLKAQLKKDGTRENEEDMKGKKGPINVQLYECHGKHNQEFEVKDSKIKSLSLGRCLTAEKAEKNSNVALQDCDDAKDSLQKWDFTGYGYVKLIGTDVCMDVLAKEKDDGTREDWTEIKAHKVVNVQLYTCHDPEKTCRVNQLWEWAPVTEGTPGEVKGCSATSRLWSVTDRVPEVAGGAGSTMVTLAGTAVASFVLGSLITGRMARRSTAIGQADMEMLADQ